MKWSAVLHPLCFILLLLGCSTVHASQVSFNSNGYDDIVVGISSAAPKNQAEIILENIKVVAHISVICQGITFIAVCALRQ